MSESSTPTRQPGPEHRRLQEIVGVWDVECSYFTPPGHEPLQISAVEHVTALGGFWVVARFEADMFGVPFEGLSTIGFDPLRERWTATWIDVMSPHLFAFEGDYDDAGEVLTMSALAPAPTSPELAHYRTTERRLDEHTREFEMFVTTDGSAEHRLLSYLYRRRH